jgi:fumarate reductase flavoprotein subunit
MEQHIRSGKSVKSRFGEHLWLDIRLLGARHIETNLREVKEICEYFLGIDPIHQMIPVRPAQHYTMGGVRTDHTGQSPTLKGLFSAARRPAGTCTGSIASAAIPSPKPSWPA